MANEGKMIEFNVNGRTASGYLIDGLDGGPQPGLIVVHEWWGLNDHIKDIAGRFAKEGYVVLAPDLYDGRVTKDGDEAAKLMSGLDQTRGVETLNAAVDYLGSSANADKIGVTGFCMGGTFALLLPCQNKRIKASAPFYGDVPSETVLANLSAPVLFIGASDDPWINLDKMNALKSGLAKLHKEGEVKIYDGVGHAFFNDTRPEAYNRDAARDAWQRVTKFFSDELR